MIQQRSRALSCWLNHFSNIQLNTSEAISPNLPHNILKAIHFYFSSQTNYSALLQINTSQGKLLQHISLIYSPECNWRALECELLNFIGEFIIGELSSILNHVEINTCARSFTEKESFSCRALIEKRERRAIVKIT